MSHAVTLITSPGCHYCAQAREVLDRVGADIALEVSEIDMTSPEGAAAQKRWRAPFPPLLLLDGEMFGYGRISERKLRNRLDRSR